MGNWDTSVTPVGTTKWRVTAEYFEGGERVFSFGPLEVNRTHDFAKEIAVRANIALRQHRERFKSETPDGPTKALRQALNSSKAFKKAGL